MNVAFCQVSNKMINPDISGHEALYSEAIYNKVPGYKKSADFWEVPLWIARASFNLPTGELYIVRDVETSIQELLKFDVVMFSVLEVNKAIIKEIILNLPPEIKVIIGGYIDKDYFAWTGAKWFDSLKEGVESLGYDFKQGVSYKLFAELETIPRLTLSSGCLYHCAFCSVEKKLIPADKWNVYWEVEAMRALSFELVYLNDKTFGQAPNFTWLSGIFEHIKSFNKEFKGFIIQTTAPNFNKLPEGILQYVRFVELGIESFNNDILQAMKKPATEDNIKDAMWKVFDLQSNGFDIQAIPNIMVSLPSETYASYLKTLSFLISNMPIISHVNIYSMAVYENTEIAKTLDYSESDQNENSLVKSWGNPELDTKFYGAVLSLFTKKLNS